MIRLDTDLVVQRVSNFEEMARCRMEFRFARFSGFPGESGAFLRKGVVFEGGELRTIRRGCVGFTQKPAQLVLNLCPLNLWWICIICHQFRLADKG